MESCKVYCRLIAVSLDDVGNEFIISHLFFRENGAEQNEGEAGEENSD